MIAAKMAYGNLFLHKAKSMMLGTIMCAGIAVLFVGNSLIDTAIHGLKKMFVEGYTGDVMITGPTSFPTTIFGQTDGGEDFIPHISKYKYYKEKLNSDTRVSNTMPMLSGTVAMGLGEKIIGRGAAFGVDIENYRDFFSDNVVLVDGEWPESKDQGWIIISQLSAAMLSKSAEQVIGPGSRIVLSAINDTAGTVIRELRVAGVIRFNQSNQDLEKISLVDADSLRDLLGFASLKDKAVALSSEQLRFVESFDPEELFGEASGIDLFASSNLEGSLASNGGATDFGQKAQDSPFAEEQRAAWQFLLIRLEQGVHIQRFITELGDYAKTLDQDDHVQDWVAGAGTVARTALTIRLVFDLLVSIVAVIVVMITMNVLVVSISERVSEIGTLRALGAQKKFIRRMILLETGLLAAFAGVAGIAFGYGILMVLKRTGITAPNLFFEAVFAGKKLVPRISVGAAIRAFIWIFGMSILSSLYPIAIALRIRPIVAMQGD
jgi:putative ABC transport system permease protein